MKDNSINLYHQLNELKKIKMYFNNNNSILLEKIFPLSISLKRLRDLLSIKLNNNFNFLFNNKIIQSQEESSFRLKNIIKDDILYLNDDEFNFIDMKKQNPNENININSNFISNSEKPETNSEEPKKDIKPKFKTEVEYKLYNINSLLAKKNISPKISLNDLRENIIDLIPRMTVFLMEDKEIDPSQEEKIYVEKIAKDNIINFKSSKEDKNNPIEFEIFRNGNSYCKKEFYLLTKLKTLKTNLRFDETYKIIYKGKALSEDEEKQMTLDELCYKELKVFFIKVTNDNNNINSSINNLYSNRNLKTKNYQNTSFDTHERFDTWIIIGKEKSGKTTFINCLCNYINEIKFEDDFRYLIKAKNQNDYLIYNFRDKSNSQKIKAIEFPGFSGEIEEDKKINGNIKKYLKTVNEIKAICFVISGNETRYTDELKNIFSNFWDIFANDIKKNFIFIITNCDAKQPPVLDSIKSAEFSKYLPIERCIYKFSNSYLYEANQKDFWDTGVAHYSEMMNYINKKENITLDFTKYFIGLNSEHHNNLKNFIDSTRKLANYRYYLNIIKNIDSCDDNASIPFFLEDIYNKYQQYGTNYYPRNAPKKKTLKDLKYNNNLKTECLNICKGKIKKQKIDSALIYKSLKDFYKLKLIQNCSLKDELEDNLNNNDNNENDKSKLNQEIKFQEKLYNKFTYGPIKYYKTFLEENL